MLCVQCSQSVSSLLQYNICYNNYSHQKSCDTTQAQFQCKLFKSMHASSSQSYIYFSREAGSLQHQVICHSSTLFFSFSLSMSFLSVFHVFCHYRQSLHSATCPWRKSLQGQRRLYLGECPAQLKSSGSLWRPHSCRTTEKAGKMWLISESTTSHCTSNLRSEKSSRSLKKEITEIYQEEKMKIKFTVSSQACNRKVELALTWK